VQPSNAECSRRGHLPSQLRRTWGLNGAVTLNGGEDKPWELALIGRNLTNRLYVVAGSVVGATASGTGTAATVQGDVLGTASPPRSVTLQLTLKSSLLQGR
jgi:iron complex outermembrane receptor protein